MRIEAQDILNKTDGGLDILLMLFPHISGNIGTSKKFKLRSNDKTASANIIKKDDGNYIITDFGGAKGRVSWNGIQWYANETGLSWVEALNELAIKFEVKGAEIERVILKPEITKCPADPEEKEGFGSFELNTSFTDTEIETLLSKNVLYYLGWTSGEEKKKDAYTAIATAFKKYNFYSVKYYTWIKNREKLTFTATDAYPMFLIDEGAWKKMYQPLHHEKNRRFMYVGGAEKPKDFVHGLAQAKKEFQNRLVKAAESEADYDRMSEEDKVEARKVSKLNEFILCSGGSDALNAAVLGYWVGWMNSETAKLQPWHYAEMAKITDDVYQLQDIDDTGKASAHAIAIEYLDIKTIELPEELKQKLDRRYNPCKDLRDFFNHYTYYDFRELLKNAWPYRFWEMEPVYEGRGAERTRVGFKYVFDDVQAYNFLSKSGFYRLPVEGEKQEYTYVQIDGNIVRETKPNKVKNYIHEFLKNRQFEKELRNTIYRTTRLSEASLSNLPETELDFTDHDEKRQLLFFKNGCLEVSAEGIKHHSSGALKNYVWEKNVIEHNVKVLDKPFTITKGDDDQYRIDIHNQDCMFFQLLIQTSRVHWRTELEEALKDLPEAEAEAYRKANHINIAGDKLSPQEKHEQQLHLINKIYCIGHLLHRYKDPSKEKCVVGMDNKINDDGGSHGGSGKSIILEKAMQHIWKNTFTIPGTSPKVTENPHIYGGLTKHHQYIYMDDMDKYMKFRFFYPLVTSDQPVNPKNAQGYTLLYKEVPKFALTTNYTLLDQSPSTKRRVIYMVCGDYYHAKGEFSEYNEDRDPKSDLGKGLFNEFDRKEWNLFYNTMARCLEFYISTTDIIGPPMDNVSKRNLQTTMGLNFEAWAGVYFSEGSTNIDRLIPKHEAFEEFNKDNKSLGWSSQKFTSAIKAFCHYYGYELNPPELKNTDTGRIIHRVAERVLRREGWVQLSDLKSTEFMYIRTDPNKPLNGEVPGKPKELPI